MDLVIVLRQKLLPPRLTAGQMFLLVEVLESTVICVNLDRDTDKIVPPLFESPDDREKLFLVHRIVQLRAMELL